MINKENIRLAFCITIVVFISTMLYGVGRQKINFCKNWKFRSEITTNTPAVINFDDTAWENVNLPHTWNSTDAQDGGNNYLRTIGWYRKNLLWSNIFAGKKVYIEFLGANMQAECFVNGVSVGIHKGGYTAFRFDITNQLIQGKNIIAVKVDNRISEEIAPIAADFSFFGGIYRNVNLIVVNPVHIDMLDNGASALYLSQKNVSEKSAQLEIKVRIVNNSNIPQKVSLTAILRNSDTFNKIADIPKPIFDINKMKPEGTNLERISKIITIPAGDSYLFNEIVNVSNPHLWNGKKDPYRYLVDFTVNQDEKVIDNMSDYVGFRYFTINHDGFFLNGKLYPLRGVNRHQDRKDMGNAITKKEQNEDFGMIYEMGANAIRLSHYPQDPYFYKLCDQYGLIVWAEIPLIDRIGTDSTFNKVTKNQLREMIRQQYNCPSICIWGLQNEIRKENDGKMKLLIKELNDLVHIEDSNRLTTQATNHETARNWDSDVFAWNFYPGWYAKDETLGERMDKFKRNEFKPTGISEYGAGGSIYQHEINPAKPITTGGKWHPEEYQSLVHENAIKDISSREFVWGTFLWNMFDFASDNRNEGSQSGINDKGLVTYDRKVKKDSFYAYKVNWSNEPTVYIASRRFTERKENRIPVTVYSNCNTVELFVNGISQGIKQHSAVQCGFFKWDNILLVSGKRNKAVAKGKIDHKEYIDIVIWEKTMGNLNNYINN